MSLIPADYDSHMGLFKNKQGDYLATPYREVPVKDKGLLMEAFLGGVLVDITVDKKKDTLTEYNNMYFLLDRKTRLVEEDPYIGIPGSLQNMWKF